MKLKSVFGSLLFSFCFIANASATEPTSVEICVKSRSEYQWNKARLEEATLTTGDYVNNYGGFKFLPDGNFIVFDFGTENNPDPQFLKLTGAFTESYQEAEGMLGDRWLIAKKTSNKICQ